MGLNIYQKINYDLLKYLIAELRITQINVKPNTNVPYTVEVNSNSPSVFPIRVIIAMNITCLLYTSDAADE